MLVPKIHYPGGKDGILSRFSFWGSVLLTLWNCSEKKRSLADKGQDTSFDVS